MQIDKKKLKEEQRELAKKVVLKDNFKKIRTIAGFDVAYSKKGAICVAALLEYETLKLIEKVSVIKEINFPYISSFLAFREGPIILETLEKLEKKPDILMIDGHGIAHPEKCGLATYVGIKSKMPAIGIAKTLLLGITKEGYIIINSEKCGMVVKTKEKAKQSYVSPGNNITIEKAAEITKNMVKPPHKLPEPLHIAHKLANKLRKKLDSKT